MSAEPYNPDAANYQRDLGRYLDMAYRRADGTPDHAKFYWSSHAIRTENFSLFADLQGRIDSLIMRVQNEAPEAAKNVMITSLQALTHRLELAVVSKNSETLANGQAVSSLQNRLAKQSTEHIYTTPEQATKSFLDRLKGDRGDGS